MRPLGGFPLLEWTVRAALRADCFHHVLVTTDCENIASIARKVGAEVPFLRPKHLATNEANSADVVRHALSHYGSPQSFALLQPTSPFRSAQHLKEAVRKWQERNSPALVSVSAAKPIAWMYTMGEDLRLAAVSSAHKDVTRRQDAQSAWHPNGAIYLAKTSSFQSSGSFLGQNTIGFQMGPIDSLDIDCAEDFQIAEAIAAHKIRAIDP